MKAKFVGLLSVVWFGLVQIQSGTALTLRVSIATGSEIEVGAAQEAVVSDRWGNPIARIPEGSSLPIGAKSSLSRIGELWIEPIDEPPLIWVEGRWYRGRLQLIATSERILAVNHVDLEEYLYSVVGSEMNPSWGIEALKSQAVAARTYALYERENSSSSDFDLGSTDRYQVYRGVEAETDSTRVAVESTRGLVVAFEGKIAATFYSACSGGRTRAISDVWGTQPISYLTSVPDYDAGYRECPPGIGWGHGIGLSQYGARTLADARWSYNSILQHYYPGTYLSEFDFDPGND